MTGKPTLFGAAALLAVFACSAEADDGYVTIEGKPCNAICQAYLGVGPHAKDFGAAADQPRAETPDTAEPAPPAADGEGGVSTRQAAKPRKSSASDKAEDVPRPPIRARESASHRREARMRRACRQTGAARPSYCAERERLAVSRENARDNRTSVDSLIDSEVAPAAPRPADLTPAAAPAASAEPRPNGTAATSQPSVSAANPVANSAAKPEVERPALEPPPAPKADVLAPRPQPASDKNVLIVLADGANKTLADLADKSVAIAGPTALSPEVVGRALAAAGAPSVKVSDGEKNAVDSLVQGRVAGAVVACLPPAKAQAFRDIPGFALFKVLVAKADAPCS